MSAQELEAVENERLPAVRQPAELEVSELVERGRKIQDAMKQAMKDGEHYGVIPGTNKPTLLKPGAEKLCQLFLLDPEYDVEREWDDDHLTTTARCTLWHIPTGNRVASGFGLCSTREKKYAYRQSNRVCPICGAEAIIRGKAEYGGGWVCWKKKDGCGASFQAGDPAIESQEAGQVPNPDLPDTYNTVLKMACKRALIAAVLNGTAASDVFTQDMEDTVDSPEPAAASDGASGSVAGSEGSKVRARTKPANLAHLMETWKSLGALGEYPPSEWQRKTEEIAYQYYSESDLRNLKAPELQSMADEVDRWLAGTKQPEIPF